MSAIVLYTWMLIAHRTVKARALSSDPSSPLERRMTQFLGAVWAMLVQAGGPQFVLASRKLKFKRFLLDQVEKGEIFKS